MHEMMSNNEVDVVVILSERVAQQTHNRACEIQASYYRNAALTLKDADEMINACNQTI